jgi:hypothetical protein
MINLLRWIIGHGITLPFFVGYKFSSLFFGKQSAKKLVGPLLTRMGVIFVGFGIPQINDKQEFQEFKRKIKRNFQMYRLLYDVEVNRETERSVEFRILNCPFVSALKDFGVSELCGFACAGDYVIAKENESKWKFKRTHSHGTDGQCCDHTYSSIDIASDLSTKKIY